MSDPRDAVVRAAKILCSGGSREIGMQALRTALDTLDALPAARQMPSAYEPYDSDGFDKHGVCMRTKCRRSHTKYGACGGGALPPKAPAPSSGHAPTPGAAGAHGEDRYGLDDYMNAPSGIGPLAAEWKDKPHRLVYDLVGRLRTAPSSSPVGGNISANNGTLEDAMRAFIEANASGDMKVMLSAMERLLTFIPPLIREIDALRKNVGTPRLENVAPNGDPFSPEVQRIASEMMQLSGSSLFLAICACVSKARAMDIPMPPPVSIAAPCNACNAILKDGTVFHETTCPRVAGRGSCEDEITNALLTKARSMILWLREEQIPDADRDALPKDVLIRLADILESRMPASVTGPDPKALLQYVRFVQRLAGSEHHDNCIAADWYEGALADEDEDCDCGVADAKEIVEAHPIDLNAPPFTYSVVEKKE